MSKSVDLIVLGKLKDKNFIAIEDDYLKRCKSHPLNIYELKANAENRKQEGDLIAKKVSEIKLKNQNVHLALLTEDGKEFDSRSFSKWLFDKVESNTKVIFAIGGAEGHGEEIRAQSQSKISLSQLTLPHKLARIVFVEQYYRALTIYQNHPYHN